MPTISSSPAGHRAWLFSPARSIALSSLLFLTLTVAQAASPYSNSGRSPLVHYSNTTWALEKSGTFTAGATEGTGTANWVVNYTKVESTRSLVALGYIEIFNADFVSVTIDSIVINLQVGGITKTSNVATAAAGDAATSAFVDSASSSEGLGFFAENAASGAIALIHGATDLPTTVDAGIVLTARSLLRLYFISDYDPAVLGLNTGSPARAEVIVTFNNGLGTSFQHASLVPALVELNAAPTLIDNALATTGTATAGSFTAISEVVTDTGSIGFSVSVDGGQDGGTVCNTALLSSPPASFPIIKHDVVVANLEIPGLDLTASACVDVPGRTPPPGGDDYATNTQGGWGSKPNGNNPGARLAEHFASVYPAGVSIGGTYTLHFTSAAAISAFLPQGGKPAVLSASAVNPTKKLTVFAGQTLALTLNIDFSAAGLMPGGATGLGGLKVTSGKLAGWTASQVLWLCNQVLGGNLAALPAGVSLSDLNNVADAINNNFTDGDHDNGYLSP